MTKIYYENSSLTLDAGAGSPTLGAWFVKAEPSIAEVSGLQTSLNGKADNSRLLTDVPSGALFSDTIYTHPATHSIAEVSGLQTALNGKRLITDSYSKSEMDTLSLLLAPLSHMHQTGDVTGLTGALAAKANTSALLQVYSGSG